MKKIISIILPPFIGSLLLTGIAFYDEKRTDYRDLESCEIFTLTLPDYFILLTGLTIIGGLIQIGIVEQIIKRFKFLKIIHWISIGGLLIILFGLGFGVLIWSEKLGIKDLINSTLIGCSIAAVYVVGNLVTVRMMRKKKYGI